MTLYKMNKLSVFSWAMYDFANTIFAMNVVSLYFPVWVTEDMKAQDISYSIAVTCSLILAGALAPFLGAVSDRWGRKKPFLILFTVICCLSCMLIGFARNLLLGLSLFLIANLFYHLGGVFYNTLLPQVSSKTHLGRISGLGVALGYLGTISGLILVRPFVINLGRQAAFLPTGLSFLLFSLPCFLFVKETASKAEEKVSVNFGSIFKKIKNLAILIRGDRNLSNFLISLFLSLNAINTIILFMSVYTKRVMGFTDQEIIPFYVLSTVFAGLSALLSGFITDRLGAEKTLKGVFLLWIVSINLAILSFNKPLFWVVGALVGSSLGATWATTRALAVKLSPKEIIGTIFGFYGLLSLLASTPGILIWGLVAYLFGFLGLFRYRIGLFCLLIFLLFGFYFLCKIKDDSLPEGDN